MFQIMLGTAKRLEQVVFVDKGKEPINKSQF